MELLDIVYARCRQVPQKIILEDEYGERFLFRDLENLSGRIYRFLLQKKIGKEDVVAVYMKRSAAIFAAILGVWKSGAAVTVIGEGTPSETADFILKDSAAKYVFDDRSWEQALQTEYLEGYRTTGLHDLACIAYSSGSGGFFKGAVHEFGAIQRLVEDEKTFPEDYSNIRAVFNARFYMASAFFSLVDIVYWGYYTFIAPLKVLNDDEKMIALLREKEVSCIICSPSLLQTLQSADLPHLLEVDLCFEAAGGETNPNFLTTNSYGLTESLSTLTTLKIEKNYEIFPVGKPEKNVTLSLVREDGSSVSPGEIGEIRFVPEYFRGYRNLPEKTAEAVRDGWFYTGDMGYFDEDGNLVVLGRKTDLLKTPEGYIVPVLISARLKRALPEIKKSFVRLFPHEDTVKICLYYCSEKEFSLSEIRKALCGRIPDFMLPTHCKRMEDLIYFVSGKVNRLAFSEPD